MIASSFGAFIYSILAVVKTRRVTAVVALVISGVEVAFWLGYLAMVMALIFILWNSLGSGVFGL